MTVQLTPAQENEFADLARGSDRTPDELAQEAIAEYLAARIAHRQKIERSRAQIEQGLTRSHEEVFASLKQRFGW